MRAESGRAGQGAKVETVTASSIQNHITWRCGQDLGDSVQQGTRHSAIVQSAPGRDSRNGVTRLARAPVLRLQQVDVPATCDVEGMPAFAKQPPVVARKRQMAIAYR